MNNIFKAAVRVTSLKYLNNAILPVRIPASFINTGKQQFARSLWYTCSYNDQKFDSKLHKCSNICICGSSSRNIHTKGEKELAEFLTEEIAAERKLQKVKTIPTEVDKFKVELNGSEIKLTKKEGDETVTVSFNVNHTVDAAEEPEMNPNMDKPEFAEMKSKPNFDVDLKRGNRTLSFTCSFNADHAHEEGYDSDMFGIDEVTMYDGEWSEDTYAASGEILDGYLYDLLMNILDEKGISNEFAEKLSDLSTAYEHSCYLALLENLQKFASEK